MANPEIERVDVLVTYTLGDPPGWRDALTIPYEQWTGDLNDEHRAEIERRAHAVLNPAPVEQPIPPTASDVARASAEAAIAAGQAAIATLDAFDAANAPAELEEPAVTDPRVDPAP